MNTPTLTIGAWDISADDIPSAALPAEKWRFLLGYALLAPSIHNSQPWLFRINDAELELCADRSRACRVVDPHDRELLMSCGCVLFHLRAAMRHFDCLGSVRIFPNPDDRDLLAQLTLGREGENSTDDGQLFAAITRSRILRPSPRQSRSRCNEHVPGEGRDSYNTPDPALTGPGNPERTGI